MKCNRTVSICVDQYPSMLYPELGKQRCATQLAKIEGGSAYLLNIFFKILQKVVS